MISDVRDCSTLSRATSPTRQPYRTTEPWAGVSGSPPMAAPRRTSPRRCTRHATSATTRSCQPRQPRRWGRLLILGLTLTLVATLSTRALADDSGFFGSFGESPDRQSDLNSDDASRLTATANPTVRE